MASAGMVFLRCSTRDVHMASSFAHAPLHAACRINARAQCIEISIPKRDGHTYIHTYIQTDRQTQNEMREPTEAECRSSSI